MTTEQEKTFFDTFGIKPKYNKCELAYCAKNLSYNCNNCEHFKPKYSKITDRNYLELICVLNNYFGIDVRAIKIEELKEELLKHCIELITYELYIDDDITNLKHQVQAIFEGE